MYLLKTCQTLTTSYFNTVKTLVTNSVSQAAGNNTAGIRAVSLIMTIKRDTMESRLAHVRAPVGLLRGRLS